MDACLDYIYGQDGERQAIMRALHEQITGLPGIVPKIRHRIPFYYRKSWICYLNPVGASEVELGFTRGNELSNRQGLLQARGRKQVRGLLLTRAADIPHEALDEIFQEALLLDETVPYRGPARRHNQT